MSTNAHSPESASQHLRDQLTRWTDQTIRSAARKYRWLVWMPTRRLVHLHSPAAILGLRLQTGNIHNMVPFTDHHCLPFPPDRLSMTATTITRTLRLWTPTRTHLQPSLARLPSRTLTALGPWRPFVRGARAAVRWPHPSQRAIMSRIPPTASAACRYLLHRNIRKRQVRVCRA